MKAIFALTFLALASTTAQAKMSQEECKAEGHQWNKEKKICTMSLREMQGHENLGKDGCASEGLVWDSERRTCMIPVDSEDAKD